MKEIKASVSHLKARRTALAPVQVDVPSELSALDLRSAATALEDLVEEVYPNSLGSIDRVVLAEVATWLRRAAKIAEPRDIADWDTVQAIREDREQRSTNQVAASRYGVGEATMREASLGKRMDRSRRRIVR